MIRQLHTKHIKRIARLSSRCMQSGITEGGSTPGISKMTTSGELKIVE